MFISFNKYLIPLLIGLFVTVGGCKESNDCNGVVQGFSFEIERNFLFDRSSCVSLDKEEYRYPNIVGQSAQIIGDKLYVLSSESQTSASSVLEIDSGMNEVWRGNLTVNGIRIDAHPTSISYKAGYPVLIGAYQKFYVVDWDLFRTDGTLDRALLGEIGDPLSVAYSRGEYVTFEGKTYLASSDYCKKNGNEMRLYDAEKLAAAMNTTDDGLLAKRVTIPQFVQSIVWDGSNVILARNTNCMAGMGLSWFDLSGEVVTNNQCYDGWDELEGYRRLSSGREIFLTGASGEDGGLIFATNPEP